VTVVTENRDERHVSRICSYGDFSGQVRASRPYGCCWDRRTNPTKSQWRRWLNKGRAGPHQGPKAQQLKIPAMIRLPPEIVVYVSILVASE